MKNIEDRILYIGQKSLKDHTDSLIKFIEDMSQLKWLDKEEAIEYVDKRLKEI